MFSYNVVSAIEAIFHKHAFWYAQSTLLTERCNVSFERFAIQSDTSLTLDLIFCSPTFNFLGRRLQLPEGYHGVVLRTEGTVHSDDQGELPALLESQEVQVDTPRCYQRYKYLFTCNSYTDFRGCVQQIIAIVDFDVYSNKDGHGGLRANLKT